jgi:hypothetical protein
MDWIFMGREEKVIRYWLNVIGEEGEKTLRGLKV